MAINIGAVDDDVADVDADAKDNASILWHASG
jgi:hypothetical protein